jgi:hypothetical protein
MAYGQVKLPTPIQRQMINRWVHDRLPRSQIARPVNHTPRSRPSSFSDVEDTGPVAALSAIKRSTSRRNHLSMLPRPSIVPRSFWRGQFLPSNINRGRVSLRARTRGGDDSTTSLTTPVSASSQKSTRPIPSSCSSPETHTPSRLGLSECNCSTCFPIVGGLLRRIFRARFGGGNSCPAI